MNNKRPSAKNWISWGNDFAFSILLGILVVSEHENRLGFLRWSVRLRNLYLSHPSGEARMDNGYSLYVGAFFLIWTSVILIFVLVRLLRRSNRFDHLLLIVIGFVAVAGYPIVSLYLHSVRAPFMIVELLLAIVCCGLWIERKWPVSGYLNGLLLIVHFSLWASFSSFPYLCCLYLWPGWVWSWGSSAGAKMRIVYPLLSMCSAMLWVMSARQVEARSRGEQRTI
jgi:hypothetical protein